MAKLIYFTPASLDGLIADESFRCEPSIAARCFGGWSALAAHAIRAGLVDEYRLLVAPTLLGGGRRILPDNVRISLDLLDERRFTNGMVYLRYRTQA
jgi:dihydrofolate reductase